MGFTTSRLVGNRVMVQGRDVLGTEGTTILDSSQWDDVKANQNFDRAADAFDAAVQEFFAPLTKAAEEISASVQPEEDPVSYVVLREATPGQQADPGRRIHLGHDATVLRILESGDTDRLVWVNDELEILERTATPADVVLPGTADVFADAVMVNGDGSQV